MTSWGLFNVDHVMSQSTVLFAAAAAADAAAAALDDADAPVLLPVFLLLFAIRQLGCNDPDNMWFGGNLCCQ